MYVAVGPRLCLLNDERCLVITEERQDCSLRGRVVCLKEELFADEEIYSLKGMLINERYILQFKNDSFRDFANH